MKEVVIILFLTSNFFGLEGQKICFKGRPIEEKIVLSPIIVRYGNLGIVLIVFKKMPKHLQNI